MKFIPVVFALLLSAPHATASCVEGSSQEVIPGYEVDFKCNIYRTGKLHKNVATIEKCAQICKDAGSDHCSYGEKQKQCVVGDESGVDKPASGVSYMKRVEEEEDPFAPVDEEDPFTDLPCDQALEGCDGNRKECEADKTSLAEKLDKCEASVRCNGLSFDAAKCEFHLLGVG
ncbi:hypothetical protein N7493_007283 [Penicillium malachiteum]|uniref:Apple domain-containing protein n=1 Tax=Penicillium malachiteum TaxID=1324776 RepID=A0AAD6HJ57_9EURO|nr:hypothetical protein N7493_007283 [Penicillium malachiteum]